MSLEFVSIKKVTARKPHHCLWCWEKIEKGMSAIYYAGKFEGEFNAYYLHPECDVCSIKFNDDFSAGQFKRGSMDER